MLNNEEEFDVEKWLEENYENNYTSEHSTYLGKHFDISNRGVDFYNDNNTSIEFKECFTDKLRNQRFTLLKNQIEESDFFIFSLNYEEFHVIDSEFLREIYKFPRNLSKIRFGLLRKISIFETNDIERLKDYVKAL